jgi:hypothetical protein
MPNHTPVIVGNQQRGSAIGTLYQWTPDAWTVCDTNGQTVAQVEVGDMLSLSIQIQVKNGDPGSCTHLDIKVSRDGVDFTSLINGTVGTNGKYQLSPQPQPDGKTYQVLLVNGWQFRYLKVVAFASLANTSINCYVTGSIFASQPTTILGQSSALYLSKQWSSGISQELTQVVSASVPSSSSDGVDVTGFHEVILQFQAHATNPSTCQLWGYTTDGTTSRWSRVNGAQWTGIANTWWSSGPYRIRGYTRLYFQTIGADAPQAVRFDPIG